jgi:hypothetical protein
VRHADARVATVFYSGTFTLIAICFNLLWRYASTQKRLLDPGTDPEAISAINRAYAFGPVLYLATVLLAFVSVAASLILNISLAGFFALPSRPHRV